MDGNRNPQSRTILPSLHPGKTQTGTGCSQTTIERLLAFHDGNVIRVQRYGPIFNINIPPHPTRPSNFLDLHKTAAYNPPRENRPVRPAVHARVGMRLQRAFELNGSRE